MRTSRALAIAASIILSVPALADEPAAGDRRVAIVASPAIIPTGARCRVELEPETRAGATIETTHEGRVVAADADGLTLAVSSTRRKEVSNAEAARLPLIGRLFTNLGVAQSKPGEEKDVRIPAARIRKVEMVRN